MDFWKAIQYVTGPLSALAFIFACWLGYNIFRFRSGKALDNDYKLANSKFTRQAYAADRKRKDILIFIGVIVLFLLSFGTFLKVTLSAQQPKYQVVDVLVRYNGKILSDSFKVDYSLPHSGLRHEESKDGKATIRDVPGDATTLDIKGVPMSGYEPKPGQEYKIANGQVIVELVSTEVVPDRSAEDLPNAQSYLPSEDEQKEKPTIPDPKDALFLLTNLSNDDLKLHFYNCGKPATSVKRWWVCELPPSVKDKQTNHIPTGNGWFVAFVEAKAKKGQYTYIGTVNLQATDSPTLTVSNDGTKYKGTFTNVKYSAISPR